jgi:ferredoxin-type protein NapF
MTYRILKSLRVVASLGFLAMYFLIFVDFTGLIPATFAKQFISLQLIPAGLHAYHGAVSALVIFLGICLVTITFGRIYCSTLCPLGIMQDVIAGIQRLFRKKLKFQAQKDLKVLRYGILGLAALSFFYSAGLFLAYLDPYSNFGRISAMLFKPVVMLGNNALAFFAQKMNWYAIAHYDYKFPELSTILYSLAFLGLLTLLTLRGGRLFCNTLCPVGAFLGLLSRFSFFRIRIDETACKSCGVCEWKCKAGCIDKAAKTVDMERCVMCFNCMVTCPTSVMYLRPGRPTRKEGRKVSNREKPVDEKRRDLLLGFSALGLTTFLPEEKVIQVYKESLIKVNRQNPVTPPGSAAAYQFHHNCTACYLCISKCPTQVLQPSVIEYGLAGFMQPVFNFKYGFCNYECTECSAVCPTGALQPVDRENKKLLQLGTAKFIKDNCVVYTQGTDCGACSEHCPTKAVSMVPYKNLLAPQVTEEYCIGCGACEYACPTKPHKAIYVEGLPLHGRATKKKTVQAVPSPQQQEEFPF